MVITVEGTPAAQPRPRVARNGGVYYTGKRYAAWREKLEAEISGLTWRPTTKAVQVVLGFNGMRKGTDLDNLAKVVLDVLVQTGVIPDDDYLTVQELVVTYCPGYPEGVRIWIGEVGEVY